MEGDRRRRPTGQYRLQTTSGNIRSHDEVRQYGNAEARPECRKHGVATICAKGTFGPDHDFLPARPMET